MRSGATACREPARGGHSPLTRSILFAARAVRAPESGFYESFVLDPFSLSALGWTILTTRSPSQGVGFGHRERDDAEEAAFIHAIDLARASQLAPPKERRAYAGKARTALGSSQKPTPRAFVPRRPA